MVKLETVLKRFEDPDEVRTFEKGRFELVHIGGMTIGRATYEPGWKWSLHVGPGVRRITLQRGARWPGPLRLCHGSDGGWHHPRTPRRLSLLYSTRTSRSRQLGGGR